MGIYEVIETAPVAYSQIIGNPQSSSPTTGSYGQFYIENPSAVVRLVGTLDLIVD